MTEQKRRGRPRIERIEPMEFPPAALQAIERSRIAEAQAYAERVWAGQSESADRPWRLQRVKEALEGQGLSMEGVVL